MTDPREPDGRAGGGDGPTVHVVVLSWNGWGETEECLDSLARSTCAGLRVTVVDNASTDGTPERFEAWRARGAGLGRAAAAPDSDGGAATGVSFDLLRNEANLGFAEGNNRGIARAIAGGAGWVLVLNNDTVVEPEAIGRMVGAGEAADAAMVAPAVYDYADRARVDRFGIVLTRSGSAYDRVAPDDGPLLCPSGCAALYRRDLVTDLSADPEGFFDRRFFIYSEDLDVGLRAVARGYRTAFAADARIFHKGSAAWGLGSPRAYYLRHRNTIWAIAKAYSGRLLLREAPRLAAGQALGLLNAVRRRRFRAVLKGKVEGLAGAIGMRRGARGPRLASRERIDRRFARHGRARVAAAESFGRQARQLTGPDART